MASFRSASADAVAALTDQLGAVAESSAAKVGGELFSVAGTLRSEGTLRRFVTDQSVAPEARKGLVHQVFSAHVDAVTLDLVSEAAARKWSQPRDVADALEQVGVIAVVRSVGLQSSALVDELFSVRELVNDNSELRNALSDPSRSLADRSGLVDTLLGTKVQPATIQLIHQALFGSYRTVGAALEDYEAIAAGVQGEGVATVRVARPLKDADQQRLSAALTRQYGRPVHLNVVVEPEVLGGLRIEIGDDVIDGTVSSRLDDARRKIAG